MKKAEKIKILTEENNLLKFFTSQILTVCGIHITEMMKSGADTNFVIMSDFTLTFNVQSFVNYFMEKYSDRLSIKPDKADVERIKGHWVKFFNKKVYPEFIKELEYRRKEYGFDEPESNKEAEEVKRLYS